VDRWIGETGGRWTGGPVRPVDSGPVDRWTGETGGSVDRWTGGQWTVRPVDGGTGGRCTVTVASLAIMMLIDVAYLC
jgi:hypothetical protein